jgi:hypothetical protein
MCDGCGNHAGQRETLVIMTEQLVLGTLQVVHKMGKWSTIAKEHGQELASGLCPTAGQRHLGP